jgi:hypothetical protein
MNDCELTCVSCESTSAGQAGCNGMGVRCSHVQAPHVPQDHQVQRDSKG